MTKMFELADRAFFDNLENLQDLQDLQDLQSLEDSKDFDCASRLTDAISGNFVNNFFVP